MLTLNLLTTTIVAPPSNASKWQTGFNSAFKGLIKKEKYSMTGTQPYGELTVGASLSGRLASIYFRRVTDWRPKEDGY